MLLVCMHMHIQYCNKYSWP